MHNGHEMQHWANTDRCCTLLFQVLKVLNGKVLKSGATAAHQHCSDKEDYDLLETEYEEICLSEENVNCLDFSVKDLG